MVAGFEHPDIGRIYIGEEDVTDKMANQRNIGFVFQNYALFPHLSVFENVAYGLRVKGMEEREIEKAGIEALALVGLKGYERQFPHQLSGGEQQRVALARAVIIQPRVLLFDEPLSNLDAKLRVHMRGEIRRLQKALSITAIYVTHDQEEAMAISDHIAVMNEGKIIQIGTAEELYLKPNSPFVARFIGKINPLPAKVREAGPGQITIEVFQKLFSVPGVGNEFQSGQKVWAFIRPESVELSLHLQEGYFQGVVRERTFLGEKVDYVLEVDGHELSATSYDPLRHGTFSVNQKVGVRLDPRLLKILRGQE
jgi:iron(III) transport system ATP-binding protein